MELHYEYLIYYLLELYSYATRDDISIPLLQKGFNLILEELNNNENAQANFDFETCLAKFLNDYEDYVEIDHNTIIVLDFDALFGIISEKVPYSPLDESINIYDNNIKLFNALEIEIPLSEMAEYFKTNEEIIKTYLEVADLESKNYLNYLATFYLKKLNINLQALFEDITPDELIKIKLCLAKYNECLEDTENLYHNKGWYIALFNKNITKLYHEKVANLYYKAEEKQYALEDGTLNEFSTKPHYVSEESIFLSYFLYYLNEYLKSPNLLGHLKENLITKKYLLLSCPELEKAENYYLTHSTLDGFDPVSLTDSYFVALSYTEMLPTVMECALSLDYSDADILNNPEVYPNLILKSLFVKCYLDLAPNNHHKKEVIDLIKNAKFYQAKENFYMTNALINDIIFKEIKKQK